jgi:energy-coupling factor transporter ATP-binding protein EcfA2
MNFTKYSPSVPKSLDLSNRGLKRASASNKSTLYLKGYADGQQHHYAVWAARFESVTCSFMAGRRYAITGPNGAGKSTFMKILTGSWIPRADRLPGPSEWGFCGRTGCVAFDDYRVIDTVIMGNAPLWKALEERDKLYAKPHDQLTDADGMRSRTRGHRRRRGRLHGGGGRRGAAFDGLA